MNRFAMALLFVVGVGMVLLLLEHWGVLAEVVALIGLAAAIILILVVIIVGIVALVSIPYFFFVKKPEIREGSFTLDRLKEEK